MSKAYQRGETVLLYVNTGTDSSPTYTALESEDTLTLNMTLGTIDISDKASAGWEEGIAGMRAWDISASGIYVSSGTAFDALEDAYIARTDSFKIKVKTINGNQYTGDAYVTSLSYSAAKNDVVKVSMTIKGNGALTVATAA